MSASTIKTNMACCDYTRLASIVQITIDTGVIHSLDDFRVRMETTQVCRKDR